MCIGVVVVRVIPKINRELHLSEKFGMRFEYTNDKKTENKGSFIMYSLKRPNSKKKTQFMAVVPRGKTLVGVLTSSKAVVDRFRKNNSDIKKVFSINDN